MQKELSMVVVPCLFIKPQLVYLYAGDGAVGKSSEFRPNYSMITRGGDRNPEGFSNLDGKQGRRLISSTIPLLLTDHPQV
jgi:hypothetical protein